MHKISQVDLKLTRKSKQENAMTRKKKNTEEPKIEELSNDELDDVQGGGDDHVGAYNFRLEIDDVSSAEIKPKTRFFNDG